MDQNETGSIESFIHNIPKAELHVHIEGTLEPPLMFKLAKRNSISLKYTSVSELRKAYKFSNLQSFLDIYYEGAQVLLHEQDFYDMAWAYLKKLARQNVIHAEIFFDPQTHTSRGVSFEVVVKGIHRALQDGKEKLGISSSLIMCFLRHLSVKSAMETLEESIPFSNMISGVGLDSSEVGNPPIKFKEVFLKARSQGYLTNVAHAGEEGPPEYIWQALNELGVSRIDHGVRSLEDKSLVLELVKKQIPLTICPLSNVKLGVFSSIKEHNLKKLLDSGLNVCVNSDDPAYFGGYMAENLLAVQRALNLTHKDIYLLAKNSFSASFLSEDRKQELISNLDSFVEMSLQYI